MDDNYPPRPNSAVELPRTLVALFTTEVESQIIQVTATIMGTYNLVSSCLHLYLIQSPQQHLG